MNAFLATVVGVPATWVGLRLWGFGWKLYQWGDQFLVTYINDKPSHVPEDA